MADSIISVENLTKRYDTGYAVHGLFFEIARGECYGLLGPNGAGKTTTIGMLTRLIEPSEGTIHIDGLDLRRHRREVQYRIGFVPQDFAFYPVLSGRDNLIFFARLYGLRGAHLQERLGVVLDTVRLTRQADRAVAIYSNGMKRRLNIAIGLIHSPKILILDEPTVGIDAQSRSAILEGLESLNRKGVTILYTTHYMEEAQRLCQRVAIMDHGTIIALDSPAELIRGIGKKIIRLECEEPIHGEILVQIERVGPSKLVDEKGKVLHVKAADPSKAVKGVMEIMDKAGAHLRSIDILDANLESVFLHLTGRSLRD
jgi:ABC-2 type transport system ATP-binding protein